MKELSNTKFTIWLRKAEGRKERYIYIESYPAFFTSKKKPLNVFANT